MYYVIKTDDLNADPADDAYGRAYCDSSYHSIFTKVGRTNSSGEARRQGWLGTTNNVCLDACGAFKTLEEARAYCIEHASERQDPAWDGDQFLDEHELERFYSTTKTSVASYCELAWEAIRDAEGLAEMDEDAVCAVAERIVGALDGEDDDTLFTDDVDAVRDALLARQAELIEEAMIDVEDTYVHVDVDGDPAELDCVPETRRALPDQEILWFVYHHPAEYRKEPKRCVSCAARADGEDLAERVQAEIDEQEAYQRECESRMDAERAASLG